MDAILLDSLSSLISASTAPAQHLTSLCPCGRRTFLQGAASLLPMCSSRASVPQSHCAAMLNKIRPPRPDWYEDYFVSLMNSSMASYEADISDYKYQLFTNLRKEAKKVLEIGVGTGPNLKYYASDDGVQIIGIDPNTKMEKYAKEAAVAAGLPPANFKFVQAVGEAIPLDDASVDAVVGTLVLCSVEDIDATLRELMRVLKPGGIYLFVEHVAAKDGTILRWLQNVLDPLQQALSDGCHLTRETGKNILKAGFSVVLHIIHAPRLLRHLLWACSLSSRFFAILPFASQKLKQLSLSIQFAAGALSSYTGQRV